MLQTLPQARGPRPPTDSRFDYILLSLGGCSVETGEDTEPGCPTAFAELCMGHSEVCKWLTPAFVPDARQGECP